MQNTEFLLVIGMTHMFFSMCTGIVHADTHNFSPIQNIIFAVGHRLGPVESGLPLSWTRWFVEYLCEWLQYNDPPQDVDHIQFRSRIAFKLGWVPNERFDAFVLVDDDGNELECFGVLGDRMMMQMGQLNKAG